MSKIKFSGGFQILPEGQQKLMIESVEVLPRDGEPKSVNVKCVNEDGISWNNKYSLPRGEKALYVLVTKGLGFTAEELDGGFDPMDMVGHAFECEIIHRESDQGNVFANMGNIIGPVKPWNNDNDVPDPYDDDDLF